MAHIIRMTKHVSKLLAAVLLVLTVLLVALLSPLFVGHTQAQSIDYAVKQVPSSQRQIEMSYAPVAQQASPAVVNVYTRKIVQRRDIMRDIFGRRFSTGPGIEERVQNSLGSGVIMSSDGVIVTNNHVIEDAKSVEVTLFDNRHRVVLITSATE